MSLVIVIIGLVSGGECMHAFYLLFCLLGSWDSQ